MASLRARDEENVDFGNGAAPADSFNNNAFIVLFALIGAGMVLSSIWFFFWAKNGGFKFRQGDWDDYKSTVMRRKGPDGKTLSNATKSTKLGGGSVVHKQTTASSYTDSSYTDATTAERGEVRHEEKPWHRGGGGQERSRNHSDAHHRERRERHRHRDGSHRESSHRDGSHRNISHRDFAHDPELRSYRHEKAARVGGLNRAEDATHTEPSELSSTAPLHPTGDKAAGKRRDKGSPKKESKESKKHRKEKERREKQAAKDAANLAKRAAKAERIHNASAAKQRRRTETRDGTSTRGDDTYTAYTGETGTYTELTGSYDDAYTATASSPQSDSYYRAYRPHATVDASTNDSDTGTKAYPCHIPGLSGKGEVGVEDSVSQVAGRRHQKAQRGGFRRGTPAGRRGRRDSLSESDEG